MFGFGKKKKSLVKDSRLYAPLRGEVVELESVPDPVFAQKVMGDGFAVNPAGHHIYSPVAGKVTIKQGHAVGFRRADGLEVLLHFGIDTLGMNRPPVRLKIAVGDVVDAGEEIGKADWMRVEAEGLSTMTMVLITNTADKLKSLEVDFGEKAGGDLVGEALAK